jgi:hypothetical protein
VDCVIEGVDLYGISLPKYHSASIELFGKMVILLQVLMTTSLSLFLEGYIEANIKMPGDTNTTCQHVMLVVPDSRYNQHIPALIGTNILDNLMYVRQDGNSVASSDDYKSVVVLG